jgi:hypothetical protein
MPGRIKHIFNNKNMFEQLKDKVFELEQKICIGNDQIKDRISYLEQLSYIENIQRSFHDFSSIDKNKPSVMVYAFLHRYLINIIPLLDKFKESGFQIIIIFPILGTFAISRDFEAYKILQCKYSVFYLPRCSSSKEDMSKMSQRIDYIFYFYNFIYNFNIKVILTGDIWEFPYCGFNNNFPYRKDLMPLLVSILYYSWTDSPPEYYVDNIDYCDIYFVWGEIHKSIITKLFMNKNLQHHNDKIVCGGWGRLDQYKGIDTIKRNHIFIALRRVSAVKIGSLIESLLSGTQYKIFIKPHPENYEKITFNSSNRVVLMDASDDYIQILATSVFSISLDASAIWVESFYFKIPHIFLCNYSAIEASIVHLDPIKDLLCYDERCGFEITEFLNMVENQRNQWDRIEEYMLRFLSHQGNASEFMFKKILEMIEK